MKKNTHGEEFDFEQAGENARKLVLFGVAHKAGIFEALSEERDIPALKHLLKADERALYIVLEALCSLGYAEKKGDKYIISDKARPIFLERGEDYIGGYLPHLLDILEAWLGLPEIIKGEKTGRKTPQDISAFMHAMASKPDKFVEEVVRNCLKRKKDAVNVLDLGGGPGKYARAFINVGLKAVLYDMPETIDYVSMEFSLGKMENLGLKKGDFTEEKFEKDFKDELFDIIFMGNICHIYSADENRLLIKRVGNLLKKGGMVAIEDLVRGRSPRAEMFGVNMLAHTGGGNTWTEAEYREWLGDAGFQEIDVKDLSERESQLITAFIGKL